MKIIFLSIVLLLLNYRNSYTQDPNFEWVKQIGSNGLYSSGYCYSNSIAIDPSNNIYTVGNFSEDADFDPSPTDTFYLSVYGASDVFISKLDSNGNFIWAKQLGNNWNMIDGYSINIDNSGNIYIIGEFYDTSDFNPSPADTFCLTSFGESDVFITKLDCDGNFIWAKQIGGPSNDAGYHISSDDNNDLYITGSFNDHSDFDPSPYDSHTLISNGWSDAFVAKYDSNGNFLWVKQFGSPSIDVGQSIFVHDKQNIYFTGTFWESITFQTITDTITYVSEGLSDVFIMNINSYGEVIWVKQIGGSWSNECRSISADTYGNVYVTGYFNDSCDFDPGPNLFNLTSLGNWDSYVLKLNSNGDFIWAKQFGGIETVRSYSIFLDALDNIYTTGEFFSSVDFDPSPSTDYILSSYGDQAVFISKLNPSGDFVWAKHFGGISNDCGKSIVVDNSGNIFTTGHFMGSVDFDPSITGTDSLTSLGVVDVFIHKMNQNSNGINDNLEYSEIKVIPNPTHDKIYISSGAEFKNTSITLFNMNGSPIYRDILMTGNSFEIDLSNFSDGIYILQLIDNYSTYTTKIIKNSF